MRLKALPGKDAHMQLEWWCNIKVCVFGVCGNNAVQFFKNKNLMRVI